MDDDARAVDVIAEETTTGEARERANAERRARREDEDEDDARADAGATRDGAETTGIVGVSKWRLEAAAAAAKLWRSS